MEDYPERLSYLYFPIELIASSSATTRVVEQTGFLRYNLTFVASTPCLGAGNEAENRLSRSKTYSE